MKDFKEESHTTNTLNDTGRKNSAPDNQTTISATRTCRKETNSEINRLTLTNTYN